MQDFVCSRIAPTPSGYLHIGNAYNFLLTEEIVHRAGGGSLRLRIDDLDAPRIRPEYIEDIFESLQWIGIQPGKGPRNAADHTQHYTQQRRLQHYEAMLQQLRETGLVFACSCSRKELVQQSNDGQYAGTCLYKDIPPDTPDVAWRIQTPRESAIGFNDRIMGQQAQSLWETQRHFIIRRRDGLPAYHVASLCDDVAYGINTIVRGEDLLTSTGAQFYLANLLGLNTFSDAAFYHHPLLVDAAGGKLSKSAGSKSLKALREAGTYADKICAEAALWYKHFL